MEPEYSFKAFQVKKLLDSDTAIIACYEELKELNERLDEDIHPTMTWPTELGIFQRGANVEQIVIEREEAREVIMSRINTLKKDQALLFDSLSRLSPKEQDIVRSVYTGDQTVIKRLTTQYSEELIKSIIEKLYGCIVEITTEKHKTWRKQLKEEREKKAALIKKQYDTETLKILEERKAKDQLKAQVKAEVKVAIS